MADYCEILGQKVPYGSKKQILLKVSEFYTSRPVRIPIIVTQGIEDGPKFFLSGAIHGDEINGTEIIRRLNLKLDPEKLKGTVIALPIVNIFGFYSMTRHLPDGRDLNTVFPGSEKGSIASRLAKIVFDEVVAQCDFGIDIHTARKKRYELEHVEADLNNEEAGRLAKAFGAEFVLNMTGSKKSLQKCATDKGIPTIVFSGGEALRFHENVTKSGVKGIMNVLQHLDMIDAETRVPEYMVLVRRNISVQAKSGGMLHVMVKPGDLVYTGDRLAKILNPFGHKLEDIYAPENGVILSVSINPLVNPGMEVCTYVMLDKSLKTVERAIKQYFSGANR